MRALIFGVVFVVVVAGVASAQNVKNPSSVLFTVSADHAVVVRYDLDVIRKSDNVVIQTLNLGKPAASAMNEAQVGINVQPIAFGIYYSVMRACDATLCSPNSEPSNDWERVPGPPSKVQMK